MFMKRVIPCLLLQEGGLVKTVKFKNPRYIGDPINTVKIFNDKEVDELIILDITASRTSAPPNFKLIHEIASECFMPLCYGGGIRNIDDIKLIFSLGIEKVSLNSTAITDSRIIEEASYIFGSQSIVGSIDVKKSLLGKYHVYNKVKKVHSDPIEYALRLERLGVGEILVNSVDLDGTMQGYDIQLIKSICSAVKVPVIASGGAGNANDLMEGLVDGNASAVAAGSMFIYQGKHKAVLINVPTSQQLTEILNERMGGNN